MDEGVEGIYHNSIWPDETPSEPEPEPPSFEEKMNQAQTSLRKKIEELIRAREKRAKKDEEDKEK
jgi:hypothetical protein